MRMHWYLNYDWPVFAGALLQVNLNNNYILFIVTTLLFIYQLIYISWASILLVNIIEKRSNALKQYKAKPTKFGGIMNQ